ncbi:hypothetical protein DCAR_0727231 [Daucus carota subsp. sativus]|uniref:Uncharacterized protein n=1 Tax=Daucus carota subsp. sativus TaxID=79200 RepID=A0A164STA6_DAUCS|nr:hypothetical protein DCAR_0727231 [Daucus carota subsp. sativus]
MDITPKFVKFIGESDSEDNELRIPSLFWSKVSNLFPTVVQLFFPNGFSVWVGYDNNDDVFKGVGKFYPKPWWNGFNPGDMLDLNWGWSAGGFEEFHMSLLF